MNLVFFRKWLLLLLSVIILGATCQKRNSKIQITTSIIEKVKNNVKVIENEQKRPGSMRLIKANPIITVKSKGHSLPFMEKASIINHVSSAWASKTDTITFLIVHGRENYNIDLKIKIIGNKVLQTTSRIKPLRTKKIDFEVLQLKESIYQAEEEIFINANCKDLILSQDFLLIDTSEIYGYLKIETDKFRISKNDTIFDSTLKLETYFQANRIFN